MSSSSTGHDQQHSTLDPAGNNVGSTRRITQPVPVDSTYKGMVRILIRAPFQYKYKDKSYWVTTGEWYSLDPIKDREEILYLDSTSNPYREFMYMEGHKAVGTAEDRGEAYAYGSGYQDLVSDPTPPIRSNALLPPEDPTENPHILETLARAGLTNTPTTSPVIEDVSYVDVIVTPTVPEEYPVYAEVASTPDREVAESTTSSDVAVIEGLQPSTSDQSGPTVLYTPTPKEMREDELRSMKVAALKALTTTLGLEYKDKDSAIKSILEVE
jgi:hypothetical protein